MCKTTQIDFTKEKKYFYHIHQSGEEDYVKTITNAWHSVAPNTRGYIACSMDEATHVVFSKTDLRLAGKEGENFSPNKVYPIQTVEDTGDFLIIDDNMQAIIGFDLFIPCEYLKKDIKKESLNKKPLAKVISLSTYINKKSK